MKKIIDLKKKEQRIASSKIREKIKLKNNYDDSKLFQKNFWRRNLFKLA